MPSYYETTAAGISTSATAEGWIPPVGYYPASGYYYGYPYTGNTGQTITDVKPKPAPRPEPEPCTEEELLEFLKS